MHMEVVDHRTYGNLYENPGQTLFIVWHLSELFDVPAGCLFTMVVCYQKYQQKDV